MTGSDLDRYYTPSDVARNILARSSLTVEPRVCADSTCGMGSLLEAAGELFRTRSCLGIDRDRLAIAALRKRRPSWILSVGDLMNQKSYQASQVRRSAAKTDLLVLNPPFSQAREKSVTLAFGGEQVRCSVAMAYILRSLDLFTPRQGAVAIVPESLLYADIDATARAILSGTHTISLLAELTSKTFKGARAHAAAVQISPACTAARSPATRSASFMAEVGLVRGALPVHGMKESPRGVPYIHTTHLRELSDNKASSLSIRTESSAKGRVGGWAVLLPRVGKPTRTQLKAIKLDTEVQLSDCVIALTCSTGRTAKLVSRTMQQNFSSLTQIYRGTGARYVTIARVKEWLSAEGIRVSDE